MKRRSTKNKVKKPIYKKWWFWIIVIFILTRIFGNNGTKDNIQNEKKEPINSIEEQTEEHRDNSQSIDNISFDVSKVNNDETGNWRISKISENIEMQNFAIDYYKEYFNGDNEIHGIVNFNNNTTTRILVMGNLLDVSILEHVSAEENDAKKLFSGKLLEEYHVNIDSGEIEKIQ